MLTNDILNKLRNQKKDKEHGFTLLELMVVIGIASILAAIAIPNFATMRRDYFEQEIRQQLLSVADNLSVHQNRGFHTENYDLSKVGDQLQFATSRKSSSQTDKTTIFKMTRDESNNYCLTASSDGYTVLYDSKLDFQGGTSEDSTPDCNINLDAEPYELGTDKVLRSVSGEAEKVYPECVIRTGKSNSTLEAYGRNKFGQEEKVTLRGYIELMPDCQTVKFKLRVQEAEPTDSFSVIMYPHTHPQHIYTFNAGLNTTGEWKLPAPATNPVVILGDVKLPVTPYGYDKQVRWGYATEYLAPSEGGQ